MSDSIKSARFNRRKVLIAAAGAAPPFTISATGARAVKLTKSAPRYQDSPKEGKEDRSAWSRRRALYWRNDYFEGERP